MIEVISVRFRDGCKAYYFDPVGTKLKAGDEVVVDTAQGAEFGVCSIGNHMVKDESIVQPLRTIIRVATDADKRTVEINRKREKEAFPICEEKIALHKLEMKLVNVECSFEGNKMIFFFTADGRVDFRELVKDLASVFHSRIELRQIGVRDEAKMVGGLGICGRPFCCNGFMDEFQPVSIKMAKTQSLSLNPTKISGTCGRLMCCLKYEQHAYEDAAARMPRSDSFVQTPDGPGNVTAVNLVKETVTVRLDETNELPKSYKNTEIKVLRNGKGSREGIAIPPRTQRAEVKELESDKLSRSFGFAGGERQATPAPAPQMRDSRPSADNRQRRTNPPAPKNDKPQQNRKPRDNRDNGGDKRQQAEPPKKFVRFASSIPMANNAAKPEKQARNNDAPPKDGENQSRRPRRRPHRRGRGGGGAAPKSE